ncbi:MAG: COX15/CtaA family protein, partial [Bacteroidota bacterium]
EVNSDLDFNWSRIRILLIVSMVLYLIQIALGTQVREVIDQIAVVLPSARDQWIGNLGMEFYIHRSYSLLILGVHLYLGYLLISGLSNYQGEAVFLIKSIIGLIVLEIATGALMAYFAIPSILQPIHLLVASVIFGAQFYLFCVSTESQKQRVKVT